LYQSPRKEYQLVITASKWKDFKAKLKTITRKTKPMSFDQRMSELNSYIYGWIESRKHANIKSKLYELDGWLRNRLRYCIWHHWKKPERKRKNLIRLGIEANQAYAWSRSNMGGWAIAQSPILGTTITVNRLKIRGYVSLSSIYAMKTASLANNPLFPMF
jgi:RNA-directed DNA polymerase